MCFWISGTATVRYSVDTIESFDLEGALKDHLVQLTLSHMREYCGDLTPTLLNLA